GAGAAQPRLEGAAPPRDLDLGPPSAGPAAALDLIGAPAVGQGKDLEAARVGDDGPLPAHEAMKPAAAGDQLLAGGEMQVKGVAEHHPVAQLHDLRGGEAAHAPLRRQRDEGRGGDGAVPEMDQARAGVAIASRSLSGSDRIRSPYECDPWLRRCRLSAR